MQTEPTLSNLSALELEALLTEASKRGAKQAVALLLGVQEDDDELPRDFTELRDLLSMWRNMKVGAAHTIGRVLGWGLLLIIVLVASNFANIHWSPFQK